MIISAIIAVRNPDNCHPHLVRLHDRLWDMWCRNVPPDRQTPSITHHMSITVSHVSHIIYFSLVLGTNPHHTFFFFFPACVSLPVNIEPQHILSLCVFFSVCSTVRVERSLFWRAAGEPVGAGAEPAPARREQGRGGALEAETPHAKEPRLRTVLPL